MGCDRDFAIVISYVSKREKSLWKYDGGSIKLLILQATQGR